MKDGLIKSIDFSPTKKIVVTDDIKNCYDYECDTCSFKTNSEKKAIKHNTTTKHELWVKRK